MRLVIYLTNYMSEKKLCAAPGKAIVRPVAGKTAGGLMIEAQTGGFKRGTVIDFDWLDEKQQAQFGTLLDENTEVYYDTYREPVRIDGEALDIIDLTAIQAVIK